jgi:hypothetical protein
MYGVRTTTRGCVFVERNKYAPWGRGVNLITSPKPAPFVWRKGNGKFDKHERPQ